VYLEFLPRVAFPKAKGIIFDRKIFRNTFQAEIMEDKSISMRDAAAGDLAAVLKFLQPYMDSQQLLPRTSFELELLLKHGFVAFVEPADFENDDAVGAAERIVGFVALEVYSKKLAEIQCLAVDEKFRRRGVGRELVRRCVQRATDEKVKELLAISSSEDMLMACGFDYALPNQKRAFFLQPGKPSDE